jgi:hypothetical protein
MYAHTLRINVHINKEPPLRRTSTRALEGGVNILMSPVVTQRYPDPGVDDLVISG